MLANLEPATDVAVGFAGTAAGKRVTRRSEPVEQHNTVNETAVEQAGGWEMSSTDLQLYFEVSSAMGSLQAVQEHAREADYLLEHFGEAKAITREHTEAARLTREARWNEIANGERPPLALDAIDTSLGPRNHSRKKAA